MNGFLLVDKPAGPTSSDVVQRVRYFLSQYAEKSQRADNSRLRVGHVGTLDPFATGLLIIAVGKATKLSRFMTNRNKEYEFTLQLGYRTDTLDPEGDVVRQCDVPELREEAVDAVLDEFRGKSEQTPPMFSALKKDGKRLYELARQGKVVERESRSLYVDELLLETLKPESLELKVTCSKGTYVRVLGADIAERLNTCGTVTSLKRTKIGQFDVADSVSGREVMDHELHNNDEKARAMAHMLVDRLVSMDEAVLHLPDVVLDRELAWRMSHGQFLSAADLGVENFDASETVRVYDNSQRFIALAEVDNESLKPVRVFVEMQRQRNDTRRQ